MQRIKEALKVILMLGICVGCIMLAYRHDSNAQHHNNIKQLLDSVPSFYNKSPKDGLWEALTYYEIQYPEIVYSQAILETGHFKSKGCIVDNNLFGLYNSRQKRYYKFNHWTESVRAYKNWIQYRYKPPNDYYEFLKRIRYAGDPNYVNKLEQIVKKYGKVNQSTDSSYNKQIRPRVYKLQSKTH